MPFRNVPDSVCLVQFSCSVMSDFATPWTAACQASLSNTNSWNLLKLMSIESVMPSNHLILCCPLLLLSSIFPTSEFFPMSQFFASGGQSIGASASVLPMNIQDWFLLGWTGLISLQSKGLSRVFSNTTGQKHRLMSFHLEGMRSLCMMSFHLEGMRSLLQLCFRVLFHFVDFWCKILVVNHSLLFYFKILCFKHPIKSYILEHLVKYFFKKACVSLVSAMSSGSEHYPN